MRVSFLLPLFVLNHRAFFRGRSGFTINVQSLLDFERFLAELEKLLEDERRSLLGGNEINYTDIAFAAISGPWSMPQEYAAGRVAAVRFDGPDAPADMRRDMAAWTETYPRCTAFITRLYAEERRPDERGAPQE